MEICWCSMPFFVLWLTWLCSSAAGDLDFTGEVEICWCGMPFFQHSYMCWFVIIGMALFRSFYVHCFTC